MKQSVLFLFFFTIALSTYAQVLQPTNRDRSIDPATGRPIGQSNKNNTVKIDGEKPPITDYLKISQQRDTTVVDTTLSMVKDYKFNYLRRDDFEIMPFANIGAPNSRLSFQTTSQQLIPHLGSHARMDNYYTINDVYDYRVPTPLTELYFKTVVNQGQQLDALFTTNLSPQFNFSVSYKGMRSAGDYVNTLTSTGNFKFTSSYVSKSGKYRMRAHTTFQDLFNEETGGLVPESLEGFIQGNNDLDERARLEPNITDGESLIEGRRFYLDHDYEIIGHKDSTSYSSLRVYNKAYYEDQFYRYVQETASNTFLGESTGNSINDQSDLEQGNIELGASYRHHILGFFKAGITRHKFNYGYDRVIIENGNTITNRLIEEVYQFKGATHMKLGKFNLSGNLGINLSENVSGQYLNAQADYDFKYFKAIASLDIQSRRPDFNLLLHQSDYNNYNWQNDFSNIESQKLSLALQSSKYGELQVSLTTIQDHAYFEQSLLLDDQDIVVGYNGIATQTDQSITHLKIKAHKDIKLFKNIGLDNTVMYQQVGQDGDIINVPSIVTRNTLYYKNRFFKDALQLQAGVTFKYFTSYFSDGYDPVLGSFYSQDTAETGEFPLIDVFVNAKVRQTRIFFKVEHANAPITDGAYLAAPRFPYRDLTIRFGLVWNFFL